MAWAPVAPSHAWACRESSGVLVSRRTQGGGSCSCTEQAEESRWLLPSASTPGLWVSLVEPLPVLICKTHRLAAEADAWSQGPGLPLPVSCGVGGGCLPSSLGGSTVPVSHFVQLSTFCRNEVVEDTPEPLSSDPWILASQLPTGTSVKIHLNLRPKRFCLQSWHELETVEGDPRGMRSP